MTLLPPNSTSLLFFLLKVLSFSLIFLLVTCKVESGETVRVNHVGALKDMMKKGDTSAKISLASLSSRDNLYAIGAMAGLKGEIQVFDGKPMNSYAQGSEIGLDTSYNVEATLLVYSWIDEWVEYPIDPHIISSDQLESYVRSEAINAGINVDKPFPFLIEGKVKFLNWHVIDWKEGDMDHSHERHITSGPHGQVKDATAEVLGFYSENHKGIFTHHTSNMHMHVNVPSKRILGHVDDIELIPGCILKLPSVNP